MPSGRYRSLPLVNVQGVGTALIGHVGRSSRTFCRYEVKKEKGLGQGVATVRIFNIRSKPGTGHAELPEDRGPAWKGSDDPFTWE